MLLTPFWVSFVWLDYLFVRNWHFTSKTCRAFLSLTLSGQSPPQVDSTESQFEVWSDGLIWAGFCTRGFPGYTPSKRSKVRTFWSEKLLMVSPSSSSSCTDPTFVHAHLIPDSAEKNDDKLYFFFREKASEMGQSPMTQSRIGRICLVSYHTSQQTSCWSSQLKGLYVSIVVSYSPFLVSSSPRGPERKFPMIISNCWACNGNAQQLPVSKQNLCCLPQQLSLEKHCVIFVPLDEMFERQSLLWSTSVYMHGHHTQNQNWCSAAAWSVVFHWRRTNNDAGSQTFRPSARGLQKMPLKMPLVRKMHS